jgi:hypothetical protein
MCDWRLSHLTNFWEDWSWSRTPVVSDTFLIEHVVNVKMLNGNEHDGRSFKISRIWRNQFLTTVCSTFNPTCDAQMRTSIHLFKYDHFFIAKLIIFVAYLNWALFFSIDLQCMCIEEVKTVTNLSCLNKKNCLVKLKNFHVFLWTNAWGSLCQSFCLFYSFFQCQI